MQMVELMSTAFCRLEGRKAVFIIIIDEGKGRQRSRFGCCTQATRTIVSNLLLSSALVFFPLPDSVSVINPADIAELTMYFCFYKYENVDTIFFKI